MEIEYRCKLCFFVTTNENLFEEHNTREHQSTILKCTFCPFRTKYEGNLKILKNHLINYHKFLQSIIGKMITEILNKVRSTRNKGHPEDSQAIETNILPGHINGENREGASLITKPANANKNSFDTSFVKLEVKDDDLPPTPKKRRYYCKECSFLTKNPREYLYHLKNIHKEKIIIHKCKYCLYASKDARKVQRHENALHKRKLKEKVRISRKQKIENLKPNVLEISGLSNSKLLKQLNKNVDYDNKFKCNSCSFVVCPFTETLDTHTYTKDKIKKENELEHNISTEDSLFKLEKSESNSTLNENIQSESHLDSNIEQIDKTISKEAVVTLEDCFSQTSNSNLHKQVNKNENCGGTEFEGASCSFVDPSKEILETHTNYEHHFMDMKKIKKENEYEHDVSRKDNLLESKNTESCSTFLNEDIQIKDPLDSEIEVKDQVDETVNKDISVISPEDFSQSKTCEKENEYEHDVSRKDNLLESKNTESCSTFLNEDIQIKDPLDSEIEVKDQVDETVNKDISVISPEDFSQSKTCEKENEYEHDVSRKDNLLESKNTESCSTFLNEDIQIKDPLDSEIEVKDQVDETVNKDISVISPEDFSQSKTCPVGSTSKTIANISTDKEPFKCDNCGEKFKWKKFLLCHTQNCSANKKRPVEKEPSKVPLKKTAPVNDKEPFKCKNCQETFQCEKFLLCHIQNCPGSKRKPVKKKPGFPLIQPAPVKNEESFKCENCQKTFKLERLLLHHTWNCSGSERKPVENPLKKLAPVKEKEPFKCENCQAKFKWKKYLLLHTQKCSGKRRPDEKNTSEFCFKKPAPVKDKVASKFNQATPGSTASFHNVFEAESAVKDPASNVRSTNCNYACVRNNENEDTQSSLMKYHCPHCNYTTEAASCFCVHTIQHSNEESYRCSRCGFSSKWRWQTVQHVSIHQLCNKASVIEVNTGIFDSEMYKKYLFNSRETRPVNIQLDVMQQESENVSCKNPNNVSVSNKNCNSKLAAESEPNSFIAGVSNTDKTNYGNNKLNEKESETAFDCDDTKYFCCKHCDFKHVAKKIVVNHLATHKNIRQFICNICGFEATWRHAMVNHAKRDHDGNLNAIEDRVNFIQEGFVLRLPDFSFEGAIKSNANSVTSKSDSQTKKTYSCYLCPYTCKVEFHMQFHVSLHVDRPNLNFNCPQCPYYCKTVQAFRNHMRLHKGSSSTFTSSANNKDFDKNETNYCSTILPVESLNPVNQELLPELFPAEVISENEVSKYYCVNCPAVFDTVKGLKKHENFHGNRLPFKCNFCDFGAKYTAQLARHLTVHTAECESEKETRRFTDAINQLSLEDNLEKNSENNLKKKDKILSKKEVLELKATLKNTSGATNFLKCNYCPSSFFETSVLEYHESLHGSDGKFKCKYCNYAVNESKKLSIHNSVHSKKKCRKSFSCHKCPTVLYQQGRYERHLELHGKNLKFVCDLCDYSVQNSVNLARHKKVHTIGYKPEVAENCNDTINNELVKEMIEEPASVPNTVYICDRCPFNHSHKDVMHSHQRQHWFKDCLKCLYCDYSCKEKSCLQNHLKLHLKQKTLFIPHAFMRFESFEIYATEESGKSLLFEDQVRLSHNTEISKKANVTSSCESDVKNDSHSKSMSSLSSSKIPVVVLSDILATRNIHDA